MLRAIIEEVKGEQHPGEEFLSARGSSNHTISGKSESLS